jgi:pimeloyl-ACP methyl ester carboxylesterase
VVARVGAALVLGIPATVAGIAIGIPHALRGASLSAVLGLIALLAGPASLGYAATVTWRRVHWRGRVGVVLASLLVVQFLLFPMSQAVFATNRAPMPLPDRTPADVGLSYDDVTLTTADGVRLAAWYVPSRNGAAVVLLHGSGSTRANVLDHAAAIADRGYGVLLVDARGHGDSGGHEMDFGWFGDADIAPAVEYLRAAPDIASHRIALVGTSMGGEEAIGAAASMPAVRAVVAEGVTGRVGADWLPLRPAGIGRGFSTVFYWVQDTTAAALSRTSPPLDLRTAVVRTAPRPVLVIAGGDVAQERAAGQRLARAAPGVVQLWEVAGAGHTAGLRTAPKEWKARVGAFLDAALDAQSE